MSGAASQRSTDERQAASHADAMTSDVRDMRRVEWVASDERPEWCLICWDARPTQPHPSHLEDGPLLCAGCAQRVDANLTKHRAKEAELDRHGYRLSARLHELLVDLLYQDCLPDAAPATLCRHDTAWWAALRGIGPVRLREIEQLRRLCRRQLTG
jgi:hypothetical protein